MKRNSLTKHLTAHASTRLGRLVFPFALSASLFGCAAGNVGLGISLPIGRMGSIGVGVDSNGNLGVSAGVGVGAARVSVGSSTKIPPSRAAGTSAPQTTTTPTSPSTSSTTQLTPAAAAQTPPVN